MSAEPEYHGPGRGAGYSIYTLLDAYQLTHAARYLDKAEELIRRDLPYYDATISRTFVAGMNQFARDLGILAGQVPYEQVVATQFAPLWAG